MDAPSKNPVSFSAHDADLFDRAPVALWAEDFRGLRQIFDGWRKTGVTDLRAFLAEDPERIRLCARSIRVLKVNRRALDMLGVADLEHLILSLPAIMRDEVLPAYAAELLQLWEGKAEFSSKSVNYALDGSRIDIRLNGTILAPGDWSYVLVAIEDITAEEDARRQLVGSEIYARSLFHESPVSLWVEDFSAVKQLLDDLRARGISDLQTFTDVHPEFVERCMQEIVVIDVNQHTLGLFGARDKAVLVSKLGHVFRDEMRSHFRSQLIELWQGRLRYEREVVNYTLAGDTLHLILQFSVMPGHEADWSKVLIALTDITARKKAEAYLEYLGTHDVLSGLFNRTFYADEIMRLERRGPFPVGVIIIDLNGMKAVNDELGHTAGDAVLRRAGEVLGQIVEKPACAARIGGDEFVLLLPAAGAPEIDAVLADLQRLAEINNQFHSTAPALNFAFGNAVCESGERMEAAVQRADMQMYESKRNYYTRTPATDRRAR